MTRLAMPLVGWNIEAPTHPELEIRLLCQASCDSHSPLHAPCFHITPDQAHELISELNRVLRTMEIDQKGRATTSQANAGVI